MIDEAVEILKGDGEVMASGVVALSAPDMDTTDTPAPTPAPAPPAIVKIDEVMQEVSEQVVKTEEPDVRFCCWS